MWAPYGIRSRNRGAPAETPELQPIEANATRVTREQGRLFPVWWKPFSRKKDKGEADVPAKATGTRGAKQAVGPGEEAQISKEDMLVLQEVGGVASQPTEAQKDKRRERLMRRIARRLARTPKHEVDETS